MTETVRLTVGQAVVRFLAAQRSVRDGEERPFFAGVLGIFGHGNVAGLGQALLEDEARLRYVPARNEQAMVHVASGYAKATNRLATWACTSSIGPGATNMVTGAALATVNRLPVLLLPGDVFATRRAGAVLQQLERPDARQRCRSTTRSGRCAGSGTASGGPNSFPRRSSARCASSPTRPISGPPASRCLRTCRPKHGTSRRSSSPSGTGLSRARSPTRRSCGGRPTLSAPPSAR